MRGALARMKGMGDLLMAAVKWPTSRLMLLYFDWDDADIDAGGAVELAQLLVLVHRDRGAPCGAFGGEFLHGGLPFGRHLAAGEGGAAHLRGAGERLGGVAHEFDRTDAEFGAVAEQLRGGAGQGAEAVSNGSNLDSTDPGVWFLSGGGGRGGGHQGKAASCQTHRPQVSRDLRAPRKHPRFVI